MTKEEHAAEIARLFRAYQSPYAGHLLLALGDIQKDWPADYPNWKEFVVDLMEAMECHGFGLFDELLATQGDY